MAPFSYAKFPVPPFNKILITTGMVWLVAANPLTLQSRMEFFQLHHPLNVIVLCDRKSCEQVADYLEVDDHGHEYRVCASHTDSKTHASRLPTRKPSPDLPFRSRPAAWTVGGTPAPSEL
jgi:hypothetical protein